MTTSNAQAPLPHVARRHYFQDCGGGVGKLALGGLLSGSLVHGAITAESNPLAPRKPHFTGKAKSVIHLIPGWCAEPARSVRQ